MGGDCESGFYLYKVANGWVLEPPRNSGQIRDTRKIYVFNTSHELQQHLETL